MKTKSKSSVDDDSRVVKAEYLARRIGVAPMTVSKLASEGTVTRVGRGRYLLWPSVLTYCGRLRKGSSGRDTELAKQRARLEKVRADRGELVLDKEFGRLVDVAEIEATVIASYTAIRQTALAYLIGSRSGSP